MDCIMKTYSMIFVYELNGFQHAQAHSYIIDILHYIMGKGYVDDTFVYIINLFSSQELIKQ